MAYPKPLSAKSIEKLFSTWDPHTVEVLHTYYEAFANLYGVVQLKDAWKIFKRFEPKIRKQQFLDFSAIARREDVPYFIFEVNEIYCAEKPYDKDRFIVHKDIVDTGYGKFRFVQSLYEESCAKPLPFSTATHTNLSRRWTEHHRGTLHSASVQETQTAGR